MELTLTQFFHDFRQEVMAGAEANSTFHLDEFMNLMSAELMETGFIEGFELCHYRAQRGVRVDGYWFDDEDGLSLLIADFEDRIDLASLTNTEVRAILKRLSNFFDACLTKALYQDVDLTTPEYGLARAIFDRSASIQKVDFILVSERTLSERIQTLEGGEVAGVPSTFHIWDIARLQRQRSSRGQKEPLDIDIRELFGVGLPCLPAHLGSTAYRSYLVVVPGRVLADLYEKYGARLLEQNVRSFLQARVNVNKGIRSTILNEPEMFFAYNNGITATAHEVETENDGGLLRIVRIGDLQIVNGGQTTASLFHTRRKEKADLESISVQMKLSVIDADVVETVVPKISQFANTQNRISDADFFSNHPFHVRMEEFSRRIWAPAQQNAQRETKWFYERARGSYADAQSKLTPADTRRFRAEYPKPQMFTKTDLAKFENVWDDHPKSVNLGAQKNFRAYALRIGAEWKKDSDRFNEFYFRRAIARAIIFRTTERMVSEQPWYNGGYRANIVAYSIAAIGACCQEKTAYIDIERVWTSQSVYTSLHEALVVAAKFVSETILNPPVGISNVSEWCKKDLCWQRMVEKLPALLAGLSNEFEEDLVSAEGQTAIEKDAKRSQKVDDGIIAQQRVFNTKAEIWARILQDGIEREFLSPKEISLVKIAQQIPNKVPTEKQSLVLSQILDRAETEGVRSSLE